MKDLPIILIYITLPIWIIPFLLFWWWMKRKDRFATGDFDKDYPNEQYTPKPLQWFLDRIGKRVYRDVLECECTSCREVEKDGILITSESNAAYLCAIDSEFWAEGIKCNYRDSK